MGNAFVGVADDRNALCYNPAGLGSLDRTAITFLGLRAGMDDDLPSIVRFADGHRDEFENVDDLDAGFYEELAVWDDRWVAADATAWLDMTRKGFGIGVFATGETQVKVDRGVYEPRLHEAAVSDIVGVVGAAMPLGYLDLSVGGAAKGIWRRESVREITAREAADFDFQEIVDELETAAGGFSLDLGALWAPPDRPWSAGIVLRDGTGWIGGERIDGSLDVGASWRPLARRSGPLRGVLVAADVADLSEGVAPGTKIRLGAEARLPLLTLRAGVHQGYGTAGATLGLPVLHLDYAYWGRELGRVPGAEDQFLHSLEIGFGL
jgi:hypothetical protein